MTATLSTADLEPFLLAHRAHREGEHVRSTVALADTDTSRDVPRLLVLTTQGLRHHDAALSGSRLLSAERVFTSWDSEATPPGVLRSFRGGGPGVRNSWGTPVAAR
jgi:hypothetical protein